jgi:hypothetical protein
MNCIKKAHDRFQWWSVVTILNLQVPYYRFIEELKNCCLLMEDPLLSDISNEPSTIILCRM